MDLLFPVSWFVPVSEDTPLVSVFADLDNGKPVDCGSTEPEHSAPKTGVTGIVFAIAATGIAMTAHFKKKICA